MKSSTQTVWLRLEPKVLAKLDALAKRLKRSRSNLLAVAVDEYLDDWDTRPGKAGERGERVS